MKTNFKKLILALSVCSALSVGAIASATGFIDMPQGEVGVAMQAAVDNGLLNGMGDNKIGPDENITRSQMGAILVRAFGASEKADISAFSDMNPNAWYYEEMSKAVAMGAFQGDGANLNPEKNITFQEAFVVLSRIFDLADRKSDDTSDPLANVADAASIAPWAAPDVSLILKYGYWTPVDGNLRPTEYITRAEFAVVMNNLVKTYIDADDVTSETAQVLVVAENTSTSYETQEIQSVALNNEGNVVIRIPDITVKNYNDANGDIYVSDGVTGKITFTDCVLNRVVARNGNIDYISGQATEIRMLTPGNNCFINSDASVKFFDGEGCTVVFPAKELK